MFQIQCYSEGDWYAVRVPGRPMEHKTLEQARSMFLSTFPDSIKTRAVGNYRILDLNMLAVYPALPAKVCPQTPDRRSGTYDRLPRPERRKDAVSREWVKAHQVNPKTGRRGGVSERRAVEMGRFKVRRGCEWDRRKDPVLRAKINDRFPRRDIVL